MRAGLLVLLLLAIPAAQACQVTPIVGMDFPDRAPCQIDIRTGALDGCEPLPGLGESRTYDGMVTWEWDVDQCTAEGGIAQGDMTFTFDVSRLNPAWMPVTFDPPIVVATPAEYYNPTDVTNDPNAGRTYSSGEKPFQVTFTYERMPNAKEIENLEDRDGAARFFLKVLAESEGAQPAFGISQFTFDGRPLLAEVEAARPQDEDAPGIPLVFALAAIALAGFLRRK
jgi:hypothetical protein